MASDLTPAVIHRVTTLDLNFQPRPWPFADQRRADIDAHFALRQRDKPEIWNGRVLLGRDADISGDCFRANYFETDFASLLAWRDWGFPDPEIFNGFGMGALRCADGAFVMGEMGQHTANAGQIYFAAGTPDLDDLRDGKVDMDDSVMRELEEETGLTPTDYKAGDYWDCVVVGATIAMMRILHADLSGEAMRVRIEANLAAQDHPELSRIHLVRGISDLTTTMPRFITAFIEAQFAGS
jgi:8-oxo-dGTP pyrophosphatase MutT (NUDIX family)